MSVTTTNNRIAYDGDGVSTVFSFPYKFLATSDLKVYVGDTLQTITTDYTVGTPSDAGANVTFVTAPAVGDSNVIILRDVDLLQSTDLPSNGPFPSVSVETMVDKVTLQVQRVRELLSRAFTLPDSDTSGASTSLPTPTASNVIGWSADALSLQNYTTADFATVAASGNPITQLFSGTGAQLDYTLSAAPVSLPNLEVFISGVRQTPGSDYTLSGTTLSFVVAPVVGTDNILVRWVSAIASPVTVSDGSITLVKLADGLFTATSAALAKFADGFLAATAEARAKMADGFITTAKLLDGLLSADATGRAKMADGYVTPAKLDATAKPGKIQDIDASVSGNDLTVTINPATLDFRSATLTDGTPVSRALASAALLVVPSGATLGTVNATSARLAILAIDNAGTLEAAIVNLAGGNNLDETTLISTTAISTSADSSNVIYSTTARTNVAFRVVGFIDITEATAGTWATAPTLVQGTGGQALAALSSLGYGQNWQDVGASRASGVTYYNSTGKPISVAITCYSASSSSSSTLNIGGVIIQRTSLPVNNLGSIYGIVPPGFSYLVTFTGTSPIVTWFELR